MNLAYVIMEGILGFKRARLSTFISVVTITLSLIVLGLFVLIYVNANAIVQSFRDRVEMEVFLDDAALPQHYPSIERTMLALSGIRDVAFVSKEEAARIFKEEFGEDISKVLDFNPLPVSFKVHLDSEYRNSDSARVIAQQLRQIAGVDDVIYRKTLLELLDKRSRIFAVASLALGIALTIGAIFLVSNTIRLAIYAKRRIIATMQLVGATRAFVRMPFLIEGMLQGLIGGLLSAGFMYVVIRYALTLLSEELAGFVTVEISFVLGVVAVGTGLGLLGSLLSVRKFISESVP